MVTEPTRQALFAELIALGPCTVSAARGIGYGWNELFYDLRLGNIQIAAPTAPAGR
jgi:hypothetical protein